MTHTESIFRAANKPLRAQRCADIAWLYNHRNLVEAWGRSLGLQGVTEALAKDLYKPTPPAEPVRVDVVIPFCEYDSRYVAECVQSIFDQNHCHPTVHVVADGCDWPELPKPPAGAVLRCYATPGGRGPYWITNALVAGGNMQTAYLAIQDGDDISLPDRMWWQVQLLEATGADMISSAGRNFLQEDASSALLAARLRGEALLRPGVKFDTNPRGRCLNGTRMMRLNFFAKINGFRTMRCTGDFQFDNRARFAGASIIDDQTVLLRRRLHNGSMTGGRFVTGTDVREADVRETIRTRDLMQEMPTIEMARKLGDLSTTPGLRNR